MFILSIWNSLLRLGNECYVTSLNGKQCLLLTVEAENAKCLFPSFHIGRLCHSMGNANEKYLPQWPKSESPPHFFFAGDGGISSNITWGGSLGWHGFSNGPGCFLPSLFLPIFHLWELLNIVSKIFFLTHSLKKFFFSLKSTRISFCCVKLVTKL